MEKNFLQGVDIESLTLGKKLRKWRESNRTDPQGRLAGRERGFLPEDEATMRPLCHGSQREPCKKKKKEGDEGWEGINLTPLLGETLFSMGNPIFVGNEIIFPN